MGPENQDRPGTGGGPRQEYQTRRELRRQREVLLGGRERLVGNARVVVFLAGLGLAWLAFGAHALSGWWLLVPIVLFSVLLFIHEQVTRDWYLARRAVAFYEAGLARLDHNWQGRGQPGMRFQDENHPYTADLDIFGKGSLFELLCTARTRTGEDTLAAWLRAPADAEEIRARQAAVAELKPQLELREDLALLGSDVPVGVDFTALAAWGSDPPLLAPRWPRWIALVLGILSLVTLLGWLLSVFEVLDPDGAVGAFFLRAGSGPFVLVLVMQLIFCGFFFDRVRRVLADVEKRGRDLALLANVLARLERASFTSPRLSRLRADLDLFDDPNAPHESRGARPSQRIARLGNLLDLLNSRRNQIFLPFSYLLMWGTQMAYAIEAWRARSGRSIRRWLDVVGQFEALCSLAAYAFENPEDPFPEILTDGVCYDGEGLGHPLRPVEGFTRNDLCLGREVRVLVVSGSNMSGKSTFLRTIGINAVLALAGAPVRARRLRLTPLAVGATLHIEDSLQQGRSRFQTELIRVRQVVELARGPLPLLFLFDEIFSGTNSHDRRIGAEAVVRGLVEAGAIGLVTTHDLSLTHIVDELQPRAANVHFADHLENGVMKFDYRVQQGVVQHSNALALMRAVGLKV